MLDYEKIRERIAEHDRIWNAAIDEAARKAFTAIPNGDTAYRVSEEIKGLKK